MNIVKIADNGRKKEVSKCAKSCYFSSLTVKAKEGHAADDEDGTDDDSGHADVELGGEVVLVVGGDLLSEALDPRHSQEVGGEDGGRGADHAGQGHEQR